MRREKGLSVKLTTSAQEEKSLRLLQKQMKKKRRNVSGAREQPALALLSEEELFSGTQFEHVGDADEDEGQHGTCSTTASCP